jgi:hypothetical protein
MPTAGGISNLLHFSIFSAHTFILVYFILALLCADIEFCHVLSHVIKLSESTFN